MKHILQSDVTKIVFYVVSCFLLAALVTPWIYNAGMFLAEFTENGGTNEFLESVPHPSHFERPALRLASPVDLGCRDTDLGGLSPGVVPGSGPAGALSVSVQA